MKFRNERSLWERLKDACERVADRVLDRPDMIQHPIVALARPRTFLMGFDEVRIGPGERRIVDSYPQVPFRPTRLFIPSSVASMVEIQDIKIGQNSQICNTSAIPGETFAVGSDSPEIDFDTAEVSQRVSLTVQNKTSDRFITFSACMTGRTVV